MAAATATACAEAHRISAPIELLEEAYSWADRLATHFAQTYRSGHIFKQELNEVDWQADVLLYAYVNPVVAVALGVLLHGEKVTAAVLVGGAIVVLGVVFVITGERQTRLGATDVPECAT